MELVTKRGRIETVAERWKKTYLKQGGWLPVSARGKLESSENIYNELVNLPGDASEEQVTNIIKNQSWTRNECGECKVDAPVVVVLGEEPDYESHTAYICLDCLRKAVTFAEGKNAEA